jgi:predicted transcriptional regulator
LLRTADPAVGQASEALMSDRRSRSTPRPVDPALPTPLARILARQGRRLVWVAAQLDVDASTVSRWCSGDRPLPESRRQQLADLLGVGAASLVETLFPGPPESEDRA